VTEKGAARKRDLVESASRRGGATERLRIVNKKRVGYFAYLDLFLGQGVRSASYQISLRAQARR
jgi:hypothetical protein